MNPMPDIYNVNGNMVNNSAFFYNATMDAAGKPILVTTYSQLFQSLQIQFINILLFISIAFLILTISVLEFNKKNAPSWVDVLEGKLTWSTDPKKTKVLFLRTCAGICLPLSLFFFFLMISVKYNLNW